MGRRQYPTRVKKFGEVIYLARIENRILAEFSRNSQLLMSSFEIKLFIKSLADKGEHHCR